MLLKNTNVFVTYCQVCFISSPRLCCPTVRGVMDGAVNHVRGRAGRPVRAVRAERPGAKTPPHLSPGHSHHSLCPRQVVNDGLARDRGLSHAPSAVPTPWPNFYLKSPLGCAEYTPICISLRYLHFKLNTVLQILFLDCTQTKGAGGSVGDLLLHPPTCLPASCPRSKSGLYYFQRKQDSSSTYWNRSWIICLKQKTSASKSMIKVSFPKRQT